MKKTIAVGQLTNRPTNRPKKLPRKSQGSTQPPMPREHAPTKYTHHKPILNNRKRTASSNKLDINLTKMLHLCQPSHCTDTYTRKIIFHLRDHRGNTINKLISYFPAQIASKETKGNIVFGSNDSDYYTYDEFQTKLRMLPYWEYRCWDIYSLHKRMIYSWEDLENCTNIIIKGKKEEIKAPKMEVKLEVVKSSTIDNNPKSTRIERQSSINRVKRFDIPLTARANENSNKQIAKPKIFAIVKSRYSGPVVELKKKNSSSSQKYIIVSLTNTNSSGSHKNALVVSTALEWRDYIEQADKCMSILTARYQISKEQLLCYLEDYSKLTGSYKTTESSLSITAHLKNAMSTSRLLIRYHGAHHKPNIDCLSAQAEPCILKINQRTVSEQGMHRC